MRFLTAGLLLALAPAALAQTVYVDADLTTGANDGSSWADALQGPHSLRTALLAATPGTSIWAAEGTYLTSATGGRGQSFRLLSGVEVYGGFAGGESALWERPAIGTHPSILSADLLGNDDGTAAGRAENGFHVVNANGADQTALLDGFTVRGGNSNSGSNDRGGGILCTGNHRPRIVRCSFEDNHCTFGGGAGYINGGGAPSFVECSFLDNRGGTFGGAFDIAGGGPVLFDRCTFRGNQAQRAGALEIFSTGQATVANSIFTGNVATGSSGGGAFWIGSGGTTRVVNCTVVGNGATSNAWGGIRVQSASPVIRNTIVWGNTGTGASNQISTGANVQSCIVEGGYAGAGNLSVDPQFTDLGNLDLAPVAGSPAIDAGDGSALVAGLVADYAGGRRAWDDPTVADTGTGTPSFVDIGAHEYTTLLGSYYCDPVANTTGAPGRIEATGSSAVADNDITLTAINLPPNQFGIFVASRAPGLTPGAGGVGTLCLGGSIGRLDDPGQILDSGAAGTYSLVLDLTVLPQPNGTVAATAGETWHFQSWHRDILFVPTSNFTDAVAITLD